MACSVICRLRNSSSLYGLMSPSIAFDIGFGFVYTLGMCSFVSNELLNAFICDSMADVARLLMVGVVPLSVVCGCDCVVKCMQLDVF